MAFLWRHSSTGYYYLCQSLPEAARETKAKAWRVSTRTKRKAAAEAILQRYLRECEAGQGQAFLRKLKLRLDWDSDVPPVGGMTLMQACQDYSEHELPTKAQSTQEMERGYLGLTTGTSGILPAFGPQTPIASLTVQRIEQWRNERAAVVRPRTVNMELAVLRFVLDRQVRLGKLLKNPARLVKALAVRRPDRRHVGVFTPDEFQALARVCSPWMRRVLAFGLLTGLRPGEMHRLDWKDVDLERCLVRVYATKTDTERYVPLCGPLTAMLAAMGPKKGLVFKKANGSPMGKITVELARFVRVPDTPVNPRQSPRAVEMTWRPSPYTLRHTFATAMRERSGVQDSVIEYMLGHQRGDVQSRYLHLRPEELAGATEGLAVYVEGLELA